jgi:hypothetical protein
MKMGLRLLLTAFVAGSLLNIDARADLSVLGPSGGSQVVLDDVTGYYWYKALPDFGFQTYTEQQTTVGVINAGSFFGRSDWRMASLAEMEGLWSYDAAAITDVFTPSVAGTYTYFRGRYDELVPPDPSYDNPKHYDAYVIQWSSGYSMIGLNTNSTYDDGRNPQLSAWVVSTGVVPVPLPAAVILGSTGLGFSGWLLRRRRV